MFGIGTGELLLLLVIALLVLGPERMPKLARDVGKTVADLRRTSDELRSEFLNADQMIKESVKLPDAAAKAPPASPEPTRQAMPQPTPPTPPDVGATQGDVVTAEPDETPFDREAREARERLEDPDQHKT